MSVFRIGNRIVDYGGNLLYGTWTPPPPPKYVYLDDIHTLVPNDSTWYQINDGGIVYSQNHYNSHEGQDPSMYNVSSNVPEYDEYGWTYCEDEYVPKQCIVMTYPEMYDSLGDRVSCIECDVYNNNTDIHTFKKSEISYDELSAYPNRESIAFRYHKIHFSQYSIDSSDLYKVYVNKDEYTPSEKYKYLSFSFSEGIGDYDIYPPYGVPNISIEIPKWNGSLTSLSITVQNDSVHPFEDGRALPGIIDASGITNCNQIYINARGSKTNGNQVGYGYTTIKLATLGNDKFDVYAYTDILDLSLCTPSSVPSSRSLEGKIGVIIMNESSQLQNFIYNCIRNSKSLKDKYTLSTYEGKPAYIRNDFQV